MFGDVTYVLIAIVYGDGGHFLSISRDHTTGVLYLNDGMENNGAYVKYSQKEFPAKHKSYRLDTAFYLHPDYLRK
jgi:hypothetical protein